MKNKSQLKSEMLRRELKKEPIRIELLFELAEHEKRNYWELLEELNIDFVFDKLIYDNK